MLSAIPLETRAATYSCNGVEKKATLGISSAASVGVSSHDKICEFSIDGVSPNGQQSLEFVNSMNQMLSGQIGRNRMGIDAHFVASLLLEPFLSDRADRSAMNDFRDALAVSTREIANCMINFQQNLSSSMGSSIVRRDLVCRVLKPGDAQSGGDPTFQRRNRWDGGSDVPSFGTIEAEVSQPTLQVGVMFDRQTFLLFIPVQLIDAGINGYRLGTSRDRVRDGR
jgi:hypothetical protein